MKKITRLTREAVPFLFFLFAFLLPSQLGKHFFLPFSFASGIRIDYMAPTLYMTDLLALLLIAFRFRDALEKFRRKQVILLLILVALSGAFAVSIPLFLYRYLKLIEVIALISVFKNGFPRFEKQVVAGLALSVFLQAPLAIGQLLTRHSLQGAWYLLGERAMTLSTPSIAKASLMGNEILRPYGSFSHPNSMAGFFLLVFAFFLLNGRIKNLYLKYAVLGASSLIILFSFSKNAIIAYLLITAWGMFRKKIKCRICLISALFVPLVLASVFLMAKTDPASFEKRFTLIAQSLRIIAHDPLTGTGLGNYLLASQTFPMKYPYFFLQPVHNIFLLLMAETGIPAFLAGLYFLWKRVGSYLREPIAIGVWGAVALTGMSDHYWITLQQNMLLCATLSGIIIAWVNLKKA